MQDLMPPVNTPDKLFHDGDPTQGIEGTIVTAEWLNNDQSAVRDVQAELINVLAAAAMTPDPTKQNQLVEAITEIISGGITDGALLKENNLSDVVDKAVGRSNLELGTAATRNTADESNTNALVPVGYKGNFKSECNHDGIDFASYPFVVGESLFIDVRLSTNSPPFLNQDYYFISVICATNPAQGGRVNRPLIQFVSYTNSTSYYAIREDDGTTINWRFFHAVQYDSDNTTFTTPGKVRAFNGGVELDENAVVIRAAGNKHLYFFNTSNQEMGLVYAGDDAVLHLRGGGGPSLSIGPDGSITAPGYFGAGDDIHSGRNISSVGLIQAGAGVYDTPGVRTYSPNNPPPNQSGSTNTGNNSAYYRHGNGQIFMQCIGGVASNSSSNPDVTVYLPAAFPNGILAIAGSFNGTGGSDSDSWWSATAASSSSFNLHTRNINGTFSFVVTGY